MLTSMYSMVVWEGREGGGGFMLASLQAVVV